MYKNAVSLLARTVRGWRNCGSRALYHALSDIYGLDVKAPLDRCANRLADRLLSNQPVFAGPPVWLPIEIADPNKVIEKAETLMMANGIGGPGPGTLPSSGSQISAPKKLRARIIKSLLVGLVPAAAGMVVGLVNYRLSLAFQFCKPLLRGMLHTTIEALSIASNAVAGFLLGSLAAYLLANPARQGKTKTVKPEIKTASAVAIEAKRLSDVQAGEINLPGLQLGGLSAAGTGRPINEDALLFLRAQASQNVLMVVADGQHGAKAPALALNVFEAAFKTTDINLISAVAQVDTTVITAKKDRQADQETRTTVLAALIEPADNLAHILNVGNSRAYLVRDGRITILTRDDSFAAAEYIAVKHVVFPLEHNVSKYYEALRTAPDDRQNILTRILGEEKIGITRSDLNVTEIKLRADDLLILASNGLHGSLPFAELEKIIAADQSSPPLGLASSLRDVVKAGEHRDLTIAVYRHDTVAIS